ncbi:MAG TPA: type II CRISPR-associated endonuclease Cas1 [Xylanibacter oryzae]|nr:type II CRISPR-associated endonuclease Cas1 [Xylanibacter oryzae]
MIKKTLYFGNPAYLSLCNKQLVVKIPELERNSDIPEVIKSQSARTIPIEDIGIMVLDHKEITITHGVISALLDNSVALITCNDKRMPTGMFLSLHTVQNERFRNQLDASLPLKKQLWQQTIKAKIENQACILKQYTEVPVLNMYKMARDVKSGDPDNYEAQAAVYYWKNIFNNKPDFIRSREGEPPNNLLNYGYSILRAVVARALVVSGLLPVSGIHHHNRYNDYCLADDIMEPYRPFVDKLVIETMKKMDISKELNTYHKQEMLTIPVLDVKIGGKRSPLMIAVAQTTASLAKCFHGELRKISYPVAL